MAAKKKSAKGKATGKGKAAKRGAPPKKAVAKKKAPARKKAAPRNQAVAKKPAAAKPKPAAQVAAVKPPVKPVPAAPPNPALKPPAASAPTKPTATPSPFPATEGAFGAHDVNRGHIFGLRPRVNTSFSPQAFDNARRELAEQRYATIEDAARAVAERALELTHQRPAREPFPST